jgi:hypothetical protein|nr:MAG TPA: hypothetical protein [Caudoviricetes sp.]
MTPAEPVILTIIRGAERIFEKEGHYDIWTFSKDGGSVVSIRDCITDKILFDELPIGSMAVTAPFVYIQTKRV